MRRVKAMFFIFRVFAKTLPPREKTLGEGLIFAVKVV